MSWLTDTIAGRTIVVLLFGLGSSLALAQYLYQTSIEREVTSNNIESLTDRIITLTQTIGSIEPSKRDDTAHRMSGGHVELHWGREPLAIPGGTLDAMTERLRERLRVRAPPLAERGMVVGTNRGSEAIAANGKDDGAADGNHTTLISLPLGDGSWLNVTLARVQIARAASPSALLSAALGALAVMAVSFLMSRWLTSPLDRLATGARHLFLTSKNVQLPETGTREVRTLAAAFNDLQKRIRRLIDDRTQMLAAVSHDLRTPLTRLRLRTESISDRDVRRSIEADLDEMEAMIDATLDFLRDDMSVETSEPVDMTAIVQTIAADAVDAGQQVDVDMPRNLVVVGRHLALKRALTNLVQNAVKYGRSASVTASVAGDSLRIVIRDEGPGIAEDRLQAVFEPFFRIEPSRGRETGGHGLGLTAARAIARAHGGDVTLHNRIPRGLDAVMSLPIAAGPSSGK